MPEILGIVGYVKPGTTPPAGGTARPAASPGTVTAAAGVAPTGAATLSRYNGLEQSCLIDPNAPPRPNAPQAVGVARPMMEKEQKSGNKKEKEQKSGDKVPKAAVAKPPTVEAPIRLANKPGEPPFQLELTPESAVFVTTPSKKPVCADMSFKNTSNVKQGFKVRCTSTEIFRVQPPMGFIEAGQTQNVRIWYHSKQPNASSAKHYFVFCHKKAITGKSLDDMWARNARPDGVRRVAAQFREQQ